jgi:proton glutamate symport protein
MMLQIAVYSYLICALISGLGRLTPAKALRLFRASW